LISDGFELGIAPGYKFILSCAATEQESISISIKQAVIVFIGI
jgi:hypothetical protein